jgi:hypothetical protein
MMQHRKFVRLVAVLGLPPAHVRGLLECLWDVAYQCGQEYLGDALDVELAAGWTGETGKLCRALADCGGNGSAGFIEAVTDIRHSPSHNASEDHDNGSKPGLGVTDIVTDVPVHYRVHDLFDHAPEYVAGRAQREEERRKVKHCERCKNRYHSSDQRSRFCCPACRTANWRDRQGDCVTDGDGAKRHSDVVKRTETQRDGTPAPAPKRKSKETRDASAAPAGDGDVAPDLALTPPENTPPSGKGGKKRRQLGTPDLSRLIKHYGAEFERTQGSVPVIGAADASGAQKVLGGRSYEDAAKLVTTFLENPDDWTRERGLLRLRDLPAAATKILARASPGNGGRKRAPDGTPVGVLTELINDTVELDEEGVKRKVRIWSERATGRELRRRWGAAVEVVNG